MLRSHPAFAARWLTVKKCVIRFRHKQMPLPMPVMPIIKPLLDRQFKNAVGLAATGCADVSTMGAAMTLSMTPVALMLRVSAYPTPDAAGAGGRIALRVRTVSPGL